VRSDRNSNAPSGCQRGSATDSPGWPARDDGVGIGRQITHSQHSVIPRHRRLIPADPGQPGPVWVQSGTGHEIRAGDQQLTQFINHTTPSRTHHAAPPYSCTAVRASIPSGNRSVVMPSKLCRTNWVRPPLGRATLRPVDVTGVESDLGQPHRAGHDELGRDGGGPGSERLRAHLTDLR
jgi:hypothetical protein